jgi:hypothetical protein
LGVAHRDAAGVGAIADDDVACASLNSFTESELDELWFDSDEPSVADQALTLYASG